jgi:hypothetical protein
MRREHENLALCSLEANPIVGRLSRAQWAARLGGSHRGSFTWQCAATRLTLQCVAPFLEVAYQTSAAATEPSAGGMHKPATIAPISPSASFAPIVQVSMIRDDLTRPGATPAFA